MHEWEEKPEYLHSFDDLFGFDICRIKMSTLAEVVWLYEHSIHSSRSIRIVLCVLHSFGVFVTHCVVPVNVC